MTDTKPENPSAFPVPGLSGLPNDQFVYPDHGTTLRDYFAAAALPGLIERGTKVKPEDEGKTVARVVAEHAYFMADAMLAERAKA